MEGTKTFPFEVKVRIKGFGRYKGYSDLVPTYCCSATPSYFVTFPSIGYKGYFQKWDVEVRKRDKHGNGHL